MSAIPTQFDEPTLASFLAARLAGTAADGSRASMVAAQLSPVAPGTAPPPVIWVDGGDEVLVHLESMQTKLLDGGLLLVSVDLETDQTGRTPLIVRLALPVTGQAAGLVATTDAFPAGNGALAARWGAVLQDAVWSALLGLAQDHAAQTGLAPRGIGVSASGLTLQPGAPLAAVSEAGVSS